MNEAKFPLGRLMMTPGVLTSISDRDIHAAIRRHAMGDWGNVPPEDRKENELALREGFRILSVFRTLGGTKFWIITEADRSTTTVLLPEEY